MARKKHVVITRSTDPYIKRLEEERESLERRVGQLQAEIRTINNLIYRKKSEGIARYSERGINMKNADRLFFETIILDILANSKNGLRTSEIYNKLINNGYGMNYNTLRSYVTKMRDKSLIKKKTSTSYYWVVVDGALENFK